VSSGNTFGNSNLGLLSSVEEEKISNVGTVADWWEHNTTAHKCVRFQATSVGA